MNTLVFGGSGSGGGPRSSTKGEEGEFLEASSILLGNLSLGKGIVLKNGRKTPR